MDREPIEKIGIMGGTFNPIHNGHLLIAEYAREEFDLNRILFLPTGHSPHKSDLQTAAADRRCDMVALAIKDNPYFQLDFTEVNTPETSYTYRTLQKLKEIYPQAELYFILGADSLFDLEEWKEPAQIFSNCNILAAYREHQNQQDFSEQIAYLNQKYNARIFSLQAPVFDVSSRDIRRRIMKQKTVRYLIPEEVEDYIRKTRLYQIP